MREKNQKMVVIFNVVLTIIIVGLLVLLAASFIR